MTDSHSATRGPAAPITSPALKHGICAFLLTAATTVWAEAPLGTEGAETESEGSVEFSTEVAFDDKTSGLGVSIGYVPSTNIEVEVEGFYGRNRETTPAGRAGEGELSIKWVPEQSGLGLSYGVMLSIEREFESEPGEDREFGTEQGITGLFSYDIHNGPLVHFNLGLINEREDGEHETATTYALGFEQRIARRWTLTAEVSGRAHERADKQIGLRYKYGGDTAFFVRIGRGNDRTFGGIGFAMELEAE